MLGSKAAAELLMLVQFDFPAAVLLMLVKLMFMLPAIVVTVQRRCGQQCFPAICS
jgi:hypothetical protein